MKRVFDSTCVFLTFPLWFPILIITGLLVLIIEGRPIFFTQERAGLNEKPFRILKFRTMRPGDESDVERLSRFGRFLRASSLDELPELLHVLTGTMSLVGPRPLPTRYLPRYTAEQHRRHLVRPGITGWAQVHGRNNLDWEEKFKLDVWYVDHASFGLDLKILARTILPVICARDINSSAGEAGTMAEFKGSTT